MAFQDVQQPLAPNGSERGLGRGRGFRGGRARRGDRGGRGITASSQSRTTGARPPINDPGGQAKPSTISTPASAPPPAEVAAEAAAIAPKNNNEEDAVEADVC